MGVVLSGCECNGTPSRPSPHHLAAPCCFSGPPGAVSSSWWAAPWCKVHSQVLRAILGSSCVVWKVDKQGWGGKKAIMAWGSQLRALTACRAPALSWLQWEGLGLGEGVKRNIWGLECFVCFAAWIQRQEQLCFCCSKLPGCLCQS